MGSSESFCKFFVLLSDSMVKYFADFVVNILGYSVGYCCFSREATLPSRPNPTHFWLHIKTKR